MSFKIQIEDLVIQVVRCVLWGPTSRGKEEQLVRVKVVFLYFDFRKLCVWDYSHSFKFFLQLWPLTSRISSSYTFDLSMGFHVPKAVCCSSWLG
jgi:hypothetical protein